MIGSAAGDHQDHSAALTTCEESNAYKRALRITQKPAVILFLSAGLVDVVEFSGQKKNFIKKFKKNDRINLYPEAVD